METNKTKIWRQGDIAGVETKFPKGLKTIKTDTLLLSGSGGNPHTFKNGTFLYLLKIMEK